MKAPGNCMCVLIIAAALLSGTTTLSAQTAPKAEFKGETPAIAEDGAAASPQQLTVEMNKTYRISRHKIPFVITKLRRENAVAKINGKTVRLNIGQPVSLMEGAEDCTLIMMESDHNGSLHAARNGKILVDISC
ncbi:hypothetical protein [Pararhizobium sp.]|uniref:hypothetical protein n=1 Tax=Pararhizobium sp. TaxID=1977563 RepID=UPI00271D17DF|nr:hypothetical protein [Pararhizobium sp.]MDO9418962.1 hypothetical protein [Pararhizobium sp.]